MPKQKYLHVYCRVSSMVQVDKYSLQAQRNAGIKKAEELGYEPIFYEERGRSADKDNTLNRPEMNRLLKACEEGQVSDIFVTELDRFTRRIELILEIDKMFQKNGIRIHASSTVLDLNDSESRFITLLQSLLGERENRVKTERSIRGMTQAVKEKGLWVGVFVPYGYTKVNKCLAIHEEESEIYKEMVDMSLNGIGSATIAKRLNERNIPTRANKVLKNGINPVNPKTGLSRHIPSKEILWAPNTVTSILKNPLYKGLRRWKDELIPFPELAIIDEERWDKVQEGMKNRRNYSDRRNQHFYTLKGLLRCGVCGRNLYGRIKPDERYYMCSSKRIKSCGLRSPNLDRLDELIWNQVINSDKHLEKVMKDMADDRHRTREESKSERKALEKRMEKLKKMQTNLVELFELDRIDLNTFDERNTEHGSSIAELENQLKHLSKAENQFDIDKASSEEHIDSLDTARKMLQQLSKHEKRDVIRDIVENIIVNWDEDKQVHLVETYFKIGNVRYIAHSSVRPAHLPNPYSRTRIERVNVHFKSLVE